MNGKLVNINYCGVIDNKSAIQRFLTFPKRSPCQCILKQRDYTIIIFPNGKCRIMGLRYPLTKNKIIIPFFFSITITSLQSATFALNLCQEGEPKLILSNLCEKLQRWNYKVQYEPEIFPALRILSYNPLCVNIFGSGKCIITGAKTLNCDNLYYTLRHLITLKQ